jgi:hypothetical protein
LSVKGFCEEIRGPGGFRGKAPGLSWSSGFLIIIGMVKIKPFWVTGSRKGRFP